MYKEHAVSIQREYLSEHIHMSSSNPAFRTKDNAATMGTPGSITNPKLKTQLWEYGKRRRTDGPYADNLEVDALVVGGGFGGVFCFHSLREAGLNTVRSR